MSFGIDKPRLKYYYLTMNPIYVIARSIQHGYEEDSTEPVFVDEVEFHLGYFTDLGKANVKCGSLNSFAESNDEPEYFPMQIDNLN